MKVWMRVFALIGFLVAIFGLCIRLAINLSAPYSDAIVLWYLTLSEPYATILLNAITFGTLLSVCWLGYTTIILVKGKDHIEL